MAWAREARTIRSGVVVRPSLTLTVEGVWTPPEDHETLRAMADAGDQQALDRLADIADRHGGVEGLYELLEQGCVRAGEHLTRRTVAAGDDAGLRRILLSGYDLAARQLVRREEPSGEGGMLP